MNEIDWRVDPSFGKYEDVVYATIKAASKIRACRQDSTTGFVLDMIRKVDAVEMATHNDQNKAALGALAHSVANAIDGIVHYYNVQEITLTKFGREEILLRDCLREAADSMRLLGNAAQQITPYLP